MVSEPLSVEDSDEGSPRRQQVSPDIGAIMQHLPVTEVQRRLVRDIACTSCYQRPVGSEAFGPMVARSCEGTCPLFLHLPKLARLASQVGDRSGECDAAVKDQIC